MRSGLVFALTALGLALSLSLFPAAVSPALAAATPDATSAHVHPAPDAMPGMAVNHTAHAQPAAMPDNMPATMPDMPGMSGNQTGNQTMHVHPAPETASAPLAAPGQPSQDVSGVDEKLGQFIPADVIMHDESGRAVNVKDLVTMPTVLAPVYYSCPNECNLLLGTLAEILPQVGLKPGTEFQVLAVSFDELDTPEIAAKRKGDFYTAGEKKFPPEAWRFLTGDLPSIKRLMDSIGFRFGRVQGGFRHPVVLVVLSPSGKIIRYLYGIRPLAFDIAMACTDAAGEKPGLSVKRAIAMCYTYDPDGRKYVFNFMRVAGFGVLVAIGLFLAFLIFGGKKRTKTPPR